MVLRLERVSWDLVLEQLLEAQSRHRPSTLHPHHLSTTRRLHLFTLRQLRPFMSGGCTTEGRIIDATTEYRAVFLLR